MSQRRPKDEARSKLLEAGRAEFVASRTGMASDMLAHLRLENIAERAGYSGPGMIYNLWKDDETGLTPRELYLRDLLIEVAHAPYEHFAIAENIGDSLGVINDIDDFIRNLGNAEFERVRNDLEERFLPFWLLLAGLQVEGVAESLHLVETVSLDSLTEIYTVGLDFFSLEMVAPLEIRHLTISLRSLLAGFAEASALNERDQHMLTGLTWHDTEGWSLFAIAARALISSMTQPKSAQGAQGTAEPAD